MWDYKTHLLIIGISVGFGLCVFVSLAMAWRGYEILRSIKKVKYFFQW